MTVLSTHVTLGQCRAGLYLQFKVDKLDLSLLTIKMINVIKNIIYCNNKVVNQITRCYVTRMVTFGHYEF